MTLEIPVSGIVPSLATILPMIWFICAGIVAIIGLLLTRHGLPLVGFH